MEAKQIYEEYTRGVEYKSSIGKKGLYEQNKSNERFYVGDQWANARVSGDRPLIRYNVIRRIGDYKVAMISANPVTANYSFEGVPNTVEMKDRVQQIRGSIEQMQGQGALSGVVDQTDISSEDEMNLVSSALTDYYRTTTERLQFDAKKERVALDAYITGTGVLYWWWDADIKTGLYADEQQTQPISGDISCDAIDIECVYFGNHNSDDVQGQPSILIAQRKPLDEIKQLAKKWGCSPADIEMIGSDDDQYHSGAEDDKNQKKAVMLTRLWKENGHVYAVISTQSVIIRKQWDTMLTMYPLSVFVWDRRRNCAYGDSEVTYLIPNQIALNRMITASVWAVMMTGMPIMVYDSDGVKRPISNDPGQVIGVTGDASRAISFVNPPSFSGQFQGLINDVISNTLSQSGANDAALGNMKPDNTSAIVAVREAATMPLQMVQNRFYTFVEDSARIMADFWIHLYGKRSLKIEDDNGTWYLPFDGDKYAQSVLSVKIDVGASSMWSEATSVSTLNNLLLNGLIDFKQYLERLPKGTVPNATGLIRDYQERQAQQMPDGISGDPSADLMSMMTPEEQQQFAGLDQETQQKLIQQALGDSIANPQIGGNESVIGQ